MIVGRSCHGNQFPHDERDVNGLVDEPDLGLLLHLLNFPDRWVVPSREHP